MIQPTTSFKDNLNNLPPVDGIVRIELINSDGAIVSTIENQPGKQGSLAVYQYLHKVCGNIDTKAAKHGLEVFAEHTADAKNRPGAHPNIDILLEIITNGTSLDVRIVST